MKEKIKKLWQERKDEIIDYAILSAGLGVIIVGTAGLSWIEATRRANDKNQVIAGDVYMNLSGSEARTMIIVDHKDRSQTKLESDDNGIFDVLQRRWVELEKAKAEATE